MALVLNLKEASEEMRTSISKIAELVNSGEIPAYRDGRNWKIPRALLEDYINDRAIREAEDRRFSRPR